MTTKISGSQIAPFTIETTQLSNTAVAAFAQSLAPKVLYANVANSAFTVLDDTSVNVGGGYIVVTGSDFVSGATVLIDTTPASAVTFVNSTTLRVQVPAALAASYNLYVVNPDGGVGVKVSGITYSSEPSWTTASPLSSQVSAIAFNLTFNATSATSYALQAGSTLPTGTTLLANGYFFGTVTNASETTYSFVIVATDAENQDASKTFQVTVAIPAVRLYAWGRNASGQQGSNDRVKRSSPTQVGASTNWNLIKTQAYAATGIKTDGTLWTWGGNYYGNLGLNSAAPGDRYRSSPVQVGSTTNWSKVSHGLSFILATKTDGTLWSWGDNSSGKLGQGDTAHRSSPTQVGSGTDWNEVSVRDNMAMATKTTGTLWVWGQNAAGALGLNGDNNYKSSPVQVGANTNWSKIFAGGFNGMAIKTDGTLWLWGDNNYGQLGFNNQNIKSSPTQLGTDTNWSEISHGLGVTLAIRTNGALWAWGRNNKGQLGRNIVYTSNSSSPVQVGSSTTWSQIDTKNGVVLATKTDGTLWVWGDNNDGALGLNISDSYTTRSSPVQVGANTTWTKVATSNFYSFALTQG